MRSRSNSPTWIEYWDSKKNAGLIQGYAHTKYSFNDDLTLNVGLHSQFLTLNNSYAVEPRIGLKYQLMKNSTLSFGYGMHSQMQALDAYFIQSFDSNGNAQQLNKNLDFTRSQQLVLGYGFLPSKEWRVKTEIYYQYLSSVPVQRFASSYSMLNAGASFFPNDVSDLINEGTGENYGVELTVERYFSKGFYGLLTGSLYQAKYTASDNIERNTAFNGQYVYNLLVGKEIKVGKDKRNAIMIDLKFTQAGGRFYTPVDLVQSQAANEQVLKGDDYAFTETVDYNLDQLEQILNPDLFFRINRKIILNIESVKKISNYFNGRLILQIDHLEGDNAIVSRDRVGDFKGWLS
jgi:hypothetical protein